MRLAGQAKGGFYPTPLRVVDMIEPLIEIDNATRFAGPRVLRILDPCCGPGDAVQRLSDRIHESHPSIGQEVYGIELERQRARTATDKLDHTLQSDLFQTMVSNASFSLLYLNPPYDFDQEQKRVEQAFLTHCTKHLVTNGLLVFIVPRHRLAVSARYLSANYWNIRCYAFPLPEYEDFDQVVLLGQKRETPQLAEVAENRINHISLGPLDRVSVLEEGQEPIVSTPTVPAKTILFTTKGMDPLTAATEAQAAGLWANREMQDKFWPEETRPTRPLMPLRRGHIAQLMAAGFLDNLSIDTEDQRILVKGRTTKTSVLVSSDEEQETWQDKMTTTITAMDMQTGEITDIRA